MDKKFKVNKICLIISPNIDKKNRAKTWSSQKKKKWRLHWVCIPHPRFGQVIVFEFEPVQTNLMSNPIAKYSTIVTVDLTHFHLVIMLFIEVRNLICLFATLREARKHHLLPFISLHIKNLSLTPLGDYIPPITQTILNITAI